MGAVTGDQFFLKTVTRPVAQPAIAPMGTHGPTSSPAPARLHVHAAVAKTHISKKAVLFTVPCSVMGSAPTAGRPVNVFEFRAGFALRIVAMKLFLLSLSPL